MWTSRAIVKRIIPVLVFCRKEEGDVLVVAAVRQDHINKRGARGIAEPVHDVIGGLVFFAFAAALQIFVDAVGVDDVRGGPGGQISAVRMLFQQCSGEAVITDDAGHHGKNEHQNDDDQNAFICNVFFHFFHEISSKPQILKSANRIAVLYHGRTGKARIRRKDLPALRSKTDTAGAVSL